MHQQSPEENPIFAQKKWGTILIKKPKQFNAKTS